MRSLLVVAALAFVLASACSSPVGVEDDDGAVDEGGQGATTSAGGGTAEACDVPDTSCPPSLPYPGSPCQGALTCTYGDNAIPWSFTCESERWAGGPVCPGGSQSCGIFPEAEGCAGAFAGELAATVSIGPVELGQAFRAFEPGEEVQAEWGAQGLAMINYRVKLDGVDLPTCAMMRRTVAPEGMTPATSLSPVALRCGESLRMYVILPKGDCSNTDPIPTTLTVEVTGVGSAEVTLTVAAQDFCAPP